MPKNLTVNDYLKIFRELSSEEPFVKTTNNYFNAQVLKVVFESNQIEDVGPADKSITIQSDNEEFLVLIKKALKIPFFTALEVPPTYLTNILKDIFDIDLKLNFEGKSRDTREAFQHIYAMGIAPSIFTKTNS